MGYDVIGDIHGQADKLEALLARLGYRHTADGWRHPERIAVFVGDFIDRGPYQVRTVNRVSRMVEAGFARAVSRPSSRPMRPASITRRARQARWSRTGGTASPC